MKRANRNIGCSADPSELPSGDPEPEQISSGAYRAQASRTPQ